MMVVSVSNLASAGCSQICGQGLVARRCNTPVTRDLRQACRPKAAVRDSGQRRAGRGERSGQQRRTHYKQSDGKSHLGTALESPSLPPRNFPGPPPKGGPPLRILPIGGLGEIGMNCMLIGVGDRYVMIDAGLMFPDFQDHGMQRILPDTAFLHQWRDKIEAVIITHGHEDHIGAMPWVVPALDPKTPIYASGFVMELVQRRMQEYSLYEPSRFHRMHMRQKFQLGPFECEPIRVTHSIPDCCGMVLRCDQGTIVHTGDWKIDEKPIDGDIFDRTMFEALGKEGVTLMMSDSTNVLSPGRTFSESLVRENLIQRVAAHNGKGRVISTQFASNLHRLASIKEAADASGRKLCFMGMSLNTYMEAAHRDGRAPFDPSKLLQPAQLEDTNPNEVLIVCTGSQGEERAALNRASFESAKHLSLGPTDLILFSAKVIPGNEPKVQSMMNRLAGLGVDIEFGRELKLHASGHAYRDELEEVLRLVKPQHFLPVHGEFAFLCAHAQLAADNGVKFTSVIRNGQMLGVADRRNGKTLSMGWRRPNRNKDQEAVASHIAETRPEHKLKLRPTTQDAQYNETQSQANGWQPRLGTPEEGRSDGAVGVVGLEPTASLQLLGEVALHEFYNDGDKGTGTGRDMDIEMRGTLMNEGCLVIDVDVKRDMGRGDLSDSSAKGITARVRIVARGMWVDENRLLDQLHASAIAAVAKLPPDAVLVAVERVVMAAVRHSAFRYNKRRPEVIVLAHEQDPRMGAAVAAKAAGRLRAAKAAQEQLQAAAANRAAERERAPRRRRGDPLPIDQPGVSFPRDSSWGAQSSAAGSYGSSGTSQAPPSELASKDMLRQRRAANPRETAWKQSPDTSFD